MKSKNLLNSLMKFIVVVFTIFTMLFSDIAIVVSYAIDELTVTAENVELTASWASDADGEGVLNGYTCHSYYLRYNLKFNNIQTGFQNVELNVSNKADNTPIATFYGSQYYHKSYGSQNTGKEIGDAISVFFAKNDELYQKDIIVSVTGTYKENNETITFNKQVELKANITPQTEGIDFNSELSAQEYNYKVVSERVGVSNSVSMGSKVVNGKERNIGWYAKEVTAVYPIKIYSGVYTQKALLTVNINRKVSDVSKLSDGFEISWGGLVDDFGEPTEILNEDGSVTYIFEKGISSDEFVKENTFCVENNYDVTITYPIPNTNPEAGGEIIEPSTVCIFDAIYETEGFKTKKEYGKDEEIIKKTSKTQYSRRNTIGLGSYNPGEHAWVSVSGGYSRSSYLNADDMANIVETKKMDLITNISFNNVCNYGDYERNAIGYIGVSAPTITYMKDNKEIDRITLTSNNVKILKINEYNEGNSYFVNGDSLTEINGIYEIPEEINISNCKIKIVDFLSDRCERKFSNFSVESLIDFESLGLTDTELENIISIDWSVYRDGNRWLEGGSSINLYNSASMGNKYSYMEINGGSSGFNTEMSKKNEEESKTLQIRMFKNSETITSSKISVLNENPVFYVSLPDEFKYSNITTSISANPYITINDEKTVIKTINGEKYLVIYCDGVYDSTKSAEIDITVNYVRKLLKYPVGGNNSINVYMFTDNERYYYENLNDIRAKINDVIPEKVFLRKINYSVTNNKELSVVTSIERDDNSGILYTPDPSNDKDEWAEKNKPLIVDSNKNVIVKSEVQAIGENLNNINIISKLPIANNTLINDSTQKVLEDDYKLPEEYYNSYSQFLNGIQNNEVVPKISLNGLSIENIEVYKNDFTKVSESEYKVYYSNDDIVSFDSNNFIEYTEGADLTNAKNLKIVFNDTFKLYSGNKLYLKYKMNVPSESGMVGTVSAVKYDKELDQTSSTLYSPAAYIINGSSTSKLTVKKKFEGYNIDTAPQGLSLEGIQFKLKYYDEETDSFKFLKKNDEDWVETTNGEGKAVFEYLPYGEYYIYEVTEFEKYSGIGNLNYVNIEPNEVVTKIVENKIKHGNINIKKVWLGTNDQQGTVKFNVTRTTNDGITFNQDIETDEEGNAVVVGAPYGSYRITEKDVKLGWITTGAKTIDLNSADSEVVVMQNRPANTTMQIQKTVPNGENVSGLTFHITGFGAMSYTNTEGTLINNNTDLTVTIGEDYSSNSNISVNISSDGKTGNIYLYSLPLGYYTIDEINIPKIPDTDIEKYVSVSVSKNLEKDISITGTPELVKISNKYKYGTIEIHKTAKLKVGNDYVDIGDLSGFKVLVTGTSYYGTNINKVIELDENGYGTARVEIGKYTVKEVHSEGYTTYYGTSSLASTNPPEVEIKYNQTVSQELYNEHTGVGYVRVEKTLEGIDNPQKVVDAGVAFQVVGQNVAGQRVNERIEINQIDTEKNVAFGISGAISAGGEYVIQEVDSTVPDFYEPIAEQEIEVKTSNTRENPLVIEAENTRTKGNLEIITETNPEGGDLFDITYRVTNVEINNDGTYTKLGTPIELDGENNLARTSYAELRDINSGFYLVEQVTVPSGWYKDVAQIVEVPSYSTGYVTFEITPLETLGENTVIINKEVLNSNGEIATDDEYEKAGVEKNQSFEVKLTNVQTGKNYYVFFSDTDRGVIQGLDAGTYKIEEVYKPKFEVEGYYRHVNVLPNETTGENEDIAIVKQKIENQNGEYFFTIGMDSYLDEYDDIYEKEENVEITIKNKIDSGFGFGGKDSKDNISKVNVENENIRSYTKSVVFVTDEENNAIPGAMFRLLNSAGEVVDVIGRGTEFNVPNKRLVLRGLPVGKYTFECISVPDGYVLPESKELIVFEDANLVASVEVQKYIPRGDLTLSTTYVSAQGETRYLPRSKYKVVSKETGEVLKFVKTGTGDYRKSNVLNSTEVISLKSGPVILEGLETGEYEIGVVGVTKGYGIKNSFPSLVTVVENENQNVNTVVERKSVVQIGSGNQTSMYLDGNGDIYVSGYNAYYYIFGDSPSNNYSSTQYRKVDIDSKDAIIKSFAVNDQSILAIDIYGRAWAWGKNSNGVLGNTSDSISSPTQVGVGNCYIESALSNEGGLLLDSSGYVWASGYFIGDGTSYNRKSFSSPVLEFLNQGVRIKKLGHMSGYYTNNGVIDTSGKIWMWGGDSDTKPTSISYSDFYKPVCISDLYELNDIVFNDLFITDKYAMAVDSNGELWLWGTSGCLQGTLLNGTNSEPKKIDSIHFGGAKIEKISGCEEFIAVVDNLGRVWTWGIATSGQLGNDTYGGSSSIPICISNDEDEILYGKKIKDISVSYGNTMHVIAVDTDNNIWGWGGTSNYGEGGEKSNPPIKVPQRLYSAYNEHLEYNLRFKEVYSAYYNVAFAIDEYGKVWTWGNSNNGSNGIYDYNCNDILSPIELIIPGEPKIKKISSYGDNTLMVSEDGRVYITGRYAFKGDGMQTTNIGITEITKYFTLEDDSKIVDVISMSYNGDFAAIDNKGKVYTWGTGAIIGRSGSSTIIDCISDDDDELLKGKKIVKMSTWYNYSSNALILLDNQGDLYRIKSGSTAELLDSGNNFIDVEGYHLLDKYGKIWTMDFNENANLICRSDLSSNPLNKYYKMDPNFKIIKMYNSSTYGTGNVILQDSYGELWGYKYNGNDVFKLEGNVFLDGDINGNLMPKEVVSLSGSLLIDKYGQVWIFKNVSNNDGEAGNGTKTKIEKPLCLTNLDKNNLYNVKMKRILSDDYVVDTKGYMYQLFDQSYAVKSGICPVDYLEETLGKNIVEKHEYFGTSYGMVTIALDDEGKIWEGNKLGVKCLSEIENTELYNKYINDSNFKIEKIFCTDSAENSHYPQNMTKFAVDNYGKVWSWGANDNGQCGNGGTETVENPTCISELENVDLLNPTIFSNSNKTILAKDETGEVWIWGYNYGNIGNGNTNNVLYPYHINPNRLNNKKVKDIDIYYYGLLLCEDGSVYATGHPDIVSANYWKYMGMCEGAERVFNVRQGNLYLITGNNKVWTFGKNRIDSYTGLCGTGDATTWNIKTPTLISESFTIDKIRSRNKYPSSSDYVCVIDTEGKVWSWGGYNDTVRLPTMLNKTEKVIDFIDDSYFADELGNLSDIRGYSSSVISSELFTTIYGNVNEEIVRNYLDLYKNKLGSNYRNCCKW